MSDRFILLILFFFPCLAGFAQSLEFDASPDLGLNFSNLNFSIAGDLDGNNPNILSELNWYNLKSFQIGNDFGIIYNKKYLFRASYSKSFLFDGEVTDRDYASDNRQDMYTDLLINGEKGYLKRLNLSLGYKILNTYSSSFSLNFVYTNLVQKYHLLNLINPIEVESTELNSSYQTNWNNYGIFIGGNYVFSKNNDLAVQVGVQYVYFNAKANWNLIENFAKPISFTHIGNGYASELKAVNKYKVSNLISFKLSCSLLLCKVICGVDELSLKNQPSIQTKLNVVRTIVLTHVLGVVFQIK